MLGVGDGDPEEWKVMWVYQCIYMYVHAFICTYRFLCMHTYSSGCLCMGAHM